MSIQREHSLLLGLKYNSAKESYYLGRVTPGKICQKSTVMLSENKDHLLSVAGEMLHVLAAEKQ